MNEMQRQVLLSQQANASAQGIVHIESGFEQSKVSGMCYFLAEGGVIVYGDPTRLIQEQQRTYIPGRRILRVELQPDDEQS